MSRIIDKQIDTLIDTSISMNKMTGQRTFNRRIPLSSLGRQRISKSLMEECMARLQSVGIEATYCEMPKGFKFVLDLDKVVMSPRQSQAFLASSTKHC